MPNPEETSQRPAEISNPNHEESGKGRVEVRQSEHEVFPVRAILDDLPHFFQHIPPAYRDKLNEQAFALYCERIALESIRQPGVLAPSVSEADVDETPAEKKDHSGKNRILGEGSKTREVIEGRREPTGYVSLHFVSIYYRLGYKPLYDLVTSNPASLGAERIRGPYRLRATAIPLIAAVASVHTTLDTWQDPKLRRQKGRDVEAAEAESARLDNLALMKYEFNNFPLLFACHAAPHQFPRIWNSFVQENGIDSHLCSFDTLVRRYVETKYVQMGYSPYYLSGAMRQKWVYTLDQWKHRFDESESQSDTSEDRDRHTPQPSEFSPHPTDSGVFIHDSGDHWATLTGLQSLLQINFASIKEYVRSAGLTGVTVEPKNTVYSVDEVMRLPEVREKLKYQVADPLMPSFVFDGTEYVSHRYLLEHFKITKQTVSQLVSAAAAEPTKINLTFIQNNRREYTPAYDLSLLRQIPRFVQFEQAAENSQNVVSKPGMEWFFEIDGEVYSTLPEIFRTLSGSTEEKVIDAWDKQFWTRVHGAGEKLESHLVFSRASNPKQGYRLKDVQRIMEGYAYKPRVGAGESD